MIATAPALPRLVPELPMLPAATLAVLAQARHLMRAAQAGRTQPLLRGKRFGLVCDTIDAAEARLFCRAASELGAHVAHLRPVLSAQSPAEEVSDTARLLGRLYDAVECQGADAQLVRQVAQDAGVPVYDGVASAEHPSARLADLLDDESVSPEDRRRFVLQAVLVNALA